MKTSLKIHMFFPSTAQWCFDVRRCPCNHYVISVDSFYGVYSLLGGGAEKSTQQTRV